MKKFEYPERGVSLDEVSASYFQSGDGIDNTDQSLVIKTQNAGDGVYYVIETKRWAVDSFDELIEIIKDFKSRIR